MNRAFLRPGDVVADRFRVVRQLAEGGMGYVYRARQRRLDREVAVKVVAPDAERLDGTDSTILKLTVTVSD